MSLNFFQSVDDLISHQSQVLTAIIDFLLQIVLKDLQISIAIFSNFDFAKFSLKKPIFWLWQLCLKSFYYWADFRKFTT